jgi:hypothetical protein
VEVYYREHAFDFEPLARDSFSGRLALEGGKRELLAQLLADEDHCWYLDDDGERLRAEQLLARSPWSCSSPSGTIKLLCRFLDLRDGSARFDTPESYSGEQFGWLRGRDE